MFLTFLSYLQPSTSTSLFFEPGDKFVKRPPRPNLITKPNYAVGELVFAKLNRIGTPWPAKVVKCVGDTYTLQTYGAIGQCGQVELSSSKLFAASLDSFLQMFLTIKIRTKFHAFKEALVTIYKEQGVSLPSAFEDLELVQLVTI